MNPSAVRVAAMYRTAAMINKTGSLPSVGTRVANVSVDAEYGIAHLTFESGQKLAVHVDLDLGPKTDADAVRIAAETVDMIAAVFGNQLLGAKDFLNRKFHRPENWKAAKRGIPFDLVRLRRVPLDVAERLADVGTTASTFPHSRAAWQVARRFADPKPMVSQAG